MERFVIVMMDGGLGNQIGQAVFIKFLEIIYETKCIIDDSAFWPEGGTVDHNGYELDRVFGISFPLLSDVFDREEWISMLQRKKNGITIPKQLAEKGFPISVITEIDVSDSYYFGEEIRLPENISDIINFLTNLSGNLYFNGYYINSQYWKVLPEHVHKEFTFRNPLRDNEINHNLYKRITESNSVSVHIRRGDFVTLGRDVGADKYKSVIDEISSKEIDPVFFIFSDDSDWCRKNIVELGLKIDNTVFVEENAAPGCQFIDMYLMSLCKQMILCDSSFSYWAAMFNTNPSLKLFRVFRGTENTHNGTSSEDNVLFSIIIPCYNVEKYIRNCLDSLINQTIDKKELQIILVDDCSTDNTVGILQEYEAAYPELFSLILMDRNGRQGRARNIGMDYATGKYLSFIDSDDIVRLDMFEILKAIVEKNDVELVQFRYQIFQNNQIPEYERESAETFQNSDKLKIYEYKKNLKSFLLNSEILNESCTQKIYLRRLIKDANLRFMEGCAYEEPLFTYPLKFLVNRIAVLKKALYFYRENREGTTLCYMNTPNTILDHVGTQLALRERIEKTDAAKGYESETDLYFLHSLYAEPFYFMKKRGWTMPVELWRYLKEEVLKHVPFYYDNVYLSDPSLKEEKMLLDLLRLEEDNVEMQEILNSTVEKIHL